MNVRGLRPGWVAYFAVAAVLGAGILMTLSGQSTGRLPGPSTSSPIAVSMDDRFVWVVNPDNDSVSVIRVEQDRNVRVAELRVGNEPASVVVAPDRRFVYVTNTVSGTVTVIDGADPTNPTVVDTIEVGTEPFGLAVTPNGSRLYVANARTNDVSVINTATRSVIANIDGVGLEPRGIAITNDGDADDADEKVYVTQFLAVDRPGVLVGKDDYKEAKVSVIQTSNNTVLRDVTLAPLANSGFTSNGSALNRIPATNPPTFTHVTGTFPNQLNSIAIKGDRAYVPNTGASPDGPIRFNVNMQAMLSVIDTRTDTEGQVAGSTQSFNMNRGVNLEPSGPERIFFTSPWAIAFKRNSNEGYVVAASSNLLVRVVLDSNGTPTVNTPTPTTPGSVVRIFVGQNPRGIAINSRDDRAYVMNYVSRDVSVVDLQSNSVIATVSSATLPEPGTIGAQVQIGKAIFNSSTGVDLPLYGSAGQIGLRLSADGWGSCFACHPNGLTDGVVWIFGSGPRRTTPMNTTFNPKDPNDIKILNHSGIFDEVQDFENNIRNTSGGLGLITLADGVTPDPVLGAFTPASSGRSAGLDAMAAYVARGIRTPIAPKSEGLWENIRVRFAANRGRDLFREANCQSCHGGAGWSVARRDFQPPVPASEVIANGQLVRFLKDIGTFDPAALNEVRDNGTLARGADGYVPPSLLGAHGLAPYMHNGSAKTFDEVLQSVRHRTAGTNGVDLLASPEARADVAEFLKSIDASTPPIPPRP